MIQRVVGGRAAAGQEDMTQADGVFALEQGFCRLLDDQLN